ncbi:MAG: hypothetical protein QOD42_3394 [Sphingomonadales bacterium]|jgi:hypothetical protein|nr:hypothetical protein [Sphingomonadales bacterium]
MQPNYSSIGQIFSAQTRYSVPLFQRPYVWKQDEQWEPLWDDVRALADRVLHPPMHKPVAGHFLGTVVLEQIQVPTIAMPQRQVIDGQQRLTTLQILLKAAQHALEIIGHATEDSNDKRSFELAAGQISQLTLNQFAAGPDEQYKVWPTNEDRPAFKVIMDANAASGISAQDSRMAEAYHFFRAAILTWLGGSDAGRRALAFASALKDHLRLIVLDLDGTDEPQAIFETLNAHGTPLLPADLMKNWLLWEAGKQCLNAGALYDQYWRIFDSKHEYWRQEVGTGHAARPRVDTFLQNWLTAEILEAVPIKHLYDRFLAYANMRRSNIAAQELDVEQLMEEIQDSAVRFQLIDCPEGQSALSKILRRLRSLDYLVFWPVLMALMRRSASDPADLERSALALESFLVRRMVCGLQTRGYGMLALELIKAIAEADDGMPAAPKVIRVLHGPAGATNEWPSDEAFGHHWKTKRFYGWFRRSRVLMILQAIEEHYQAQATKAEPIIQYDFSKLTIEHIMPQSWLETWPLPPGADANAREDAIQSIGNLTLVSGKLNPSLSNSPWFLEGSDACKRAGLDLHSRLELNRQLLAANLASWNEAAIAKRAATLFLAAQSIWPAAVHFN